MIKARPIFFGLAVVAIFFFLPKDAKADVKEDIRVYIATTVGDQIVNIPNYGADSFGKFLFGLGGCETGWDPTNSASFEGLYQYLPSTWSSVYQAMGFPVQNIYDYKAQVNATAWVIQTGWGGGFNNWPGCTDGSGREWTQFVDGWTSVPPPVPPPSTAPTPADSPASARRAS